MPKRVAASSLILLVIVGLVIFWRLLASPLAEADTTPPPPQTGQLTLSITPPQAQATLDGLPVSSPAELSAGPHTLVISAAGYAPVTQSITIEAGHSTVIEGSLMDVMPPDVRLTVSPSVVQQGKPVDVALFLTDAGLGLAAWRMALDGTNLPGGNLTEHPAQYRYQLPLAGLDIGLHEITLRASDAGGNTAQASVWLEVQAVRPDVSGVVLPPPGEVSLPPSTPAVQAKNTPQTDLSAGADKPAEPTPTAPIEAAVSETPHPPTAPQATIMVLSREIPTNDYAPALVTRPDFPYPRLEAAKVGPVQAKPYQVIVLENDSLRLEFLPELGGRLYQVTDKDTGATLLYTNPVIKPTHWGPEEMAWWLAVGGVEWAFPVEEHGYAWGQPWQTESAILPDGAARLQLSYLDPATRLQAGVTVELPPTGRGFSLSLSLTNTGDQTAAGQMWFNAAFPAGPGMQVDFPADAARLHSAGDDTGLEAGQVFAWRPEYAAWGQWQTWFSAFAAPAARLDATIRGAGPSLTLHRAADTAAAPGFKFFTWGTAAPLDEFGGTPYFEVWGGLTADFDTFLSLKPGESRAWGETWTIE